MRLDIGSGPTKREGYVTIDLHCPEADIQVPAHQLPFDDASVDEISTSHMIEHLLPRDFAAALVEWRRVLKLGGKLIIRCPNFERWMLDWCAGDDEYRWGTALNGILGNQERGPGHWVHNAFNPQRLGALVAQAGFTVLKAEAIPTRQTKGPDYRADGDCYCEAVR